MPGLRHSCRALAGSRSIQPIISWEVTGIFAWRLAVTMQMFLQREASTRVRRRVN